MTCDFCYCELPLLAFYTPPRKGEGRSPELPINLRILAESILGREREDEEMTRTVERADRQA